MTDTVQTYQQFIGGQWVDSASAETLEVENPADATVIARVPASGAEDVDRAVDAAYDAFETWSLIATIAAGTVKRLHLELGGKAPVIVFDDADIDLVADTLRFASYWNSGQDCTAACRVIAGPGIYDNLLAALTDRVKTIKWGDPADADDLVLGGHRPKRAGAYFEPTILANPAQDSEIVQDEVFGPVVTVQRFSDEQQAVAWANDVKFGLSSSVFTGSIGKAMRVALRLQFGTVWINEHFTLASETPHGGVKESGYGKDGSKYALEDYTVVKHLTINTGV